MAHRIGEKKRNYGGGRIRRTKDRFLPARLGSWFKRQKLAGLFLQQITPNMAKGQLIYQIAENNHRSDIIRSSDQLV